MMLILVIAFSVGGWFPPGGTTTETVNASVVTLLLVVPSLTVTVMVDVPSTFVGGASTKVPKLLGLM